MALFSRLIHISLLFAFSFPGLAQEPASPRTVTMGEIAPSAEVRREIDDVFARATAAGVTKVLIYPAPPGSVWASGKFGKKIVLSNVAASKVYPNGVPKDFGLWEIGAEAIPMFDKIIKGSGGTGWSDEWLVEIWSNLPKGVVVVFNPDEQESTAPRLVVPRPPD